MNITIVQTFTDGFTTYQSGQELSVPSEVAQRWIADGKAQADTDGQQSWLSSTEVAATRALVSGDGNVLVHPRTHFQGAAALQTSGDAVFYDLAAGNHGVFGANLSRAQAWASAGFVATIDPVGGSTDSVIRIPALNFDYIGGESLLVLWSGQVTPEGADTTVMGTSYGSPVSGVRVRCKTTGQLDFALYQAGGANAFSSATTNSAAGKPFVAGETHSFAFWVNGIARTHAVWVDGTINVAEAAFGAGVAIDTKTANTWNIGAGSASPGGTEGTGTKTNALAILRFAATDALPTIAEISAVAAQWRAAPHRTILPGAL